MQVETYCRLILEYGYPAQRVQNFITVTMGVDKKEADIIVYNDDECLQPHFGGCKKQEVSEQICKPLIKLIHTPTRYNNVKYVWVTSKIKKRILSG
ncbi:MAG: hypothetical protein HOP06_03455 [Methylotenera sp.]|nr:hypothetical protein [Methylotenera sp.]